MEWYIIVMLTYLIMCMVTVVLLHVKGESCALYWALGIPYFILYALFYSVRASRAWKGGRDYYLKNGISRWQYILGKRIKTGQR